MDNADGKSILGDWLRAVSCVIVPFGLAIAMALHPLSGCFTLPSGAMVECWVSPLVRTAYPFALATLALVCALLFRLAGRSGGNARIAAAARALRPLAFAPLAPMLSFAAPWIGTRLAGLFVPFGLPLLLALAVSSGSRSSSSSSISRVSRRSWLGMAALAFATAAGVFALWIPTHASFNNGGGDSASYILQVDNLIERGDFDLTERVESAMAEKGVTQAADRVQTALADFHCKYNGEGRIYNFHSFGLPLVAWPFRAASGRFGLVAVMALIAALAAVACRETCRELGVPDAAANVATALLVCSHAWAFTALTFMPEMLGFALSACGFWALAAQGDRRRRIAATVVSAVACSYLPYAHIRFTPCALMLFGFFGLDGLMLRDEPFWRRKLPRLAAYTAACAASWLVLRHSHAVMFSGAATAAYDYGSIFASYPIAAWAMFSDFKGLVAAFPLVWWYLAATVRGIFDWRHGGRLALYAAILAGVTLLFCCTTSAALYGDCIAGRYFFSAMPFMLPFAALAFAKSGKAGRIWFAFLGLLPVCYLAFIAPTIRNGSYVQAPDTLWKLEPFQNFWRPLASFLHGTPARNAFASAFAGGMMLFTFALAGRPRLRLTRIAAAAVAALAFAAAVAAGFVADGLARDAPHQPGWILWRDFGWRSFAARDAAVGGDQARDYFRAFDPADSSVTGVPFLVMTDSPDPSSEARHVEDVTRMARNDLFGRGLSWRVLRFKGVDADADGCLAFRVSGAVARGSARFSVTCGRDFVRESETVAGEGAFDLVFIVPTHRGDGVANIAMALDGNAGEASVTRFEVAPYAPGLEAAVGAFPAGTKIVEMRP